MTTITGHQSAINSIAFSPDGQTIIAGTENNRIYIWNIANQPKIVKTLTGHSDSIKAVTVSPDGKLIASAGYDNTIKLWTMQGELLQTIKAHDLAITSLAFASTSYQEKSKDYILASGSWDNSIKIWSIKDRGKINELLHTLAGHQDGVTAIDINSQGTVLASGSGDRTIKLWHLQTGELIKNLRGHTSQINSVTFSRDDQSIISGEAQQGLFWWNLDLDSLLDRGCDRLADYFLTNPHVTPKEQKLCP